MSNKIDLKQKQDGKPRIYQPVKGTTGISRLLVWTGSEYLPPQGNSYLARRWERNYLGEKKRSARYFETLTEARDWQRQLTSAHEAALGNVQPKISSMLALPVVLAVSGPTLGDVVDRWRKRHCLRLEDATIETYQTFPGLSA